MAFGYQKPKKSSKSHPSRLKYFLAERNIRYGKSVETPYLTVESTITLTLFIPPCTARDFGRIEPTVHLLRDAWVRKHGKA